MNFEKIRRDFPILARKINGPPYAKASEGKKPLVYLDSAATSQKPKQVLAAMDEYYQNHNANVHRGIHTLSVEATEMYESARKKVADFVGVKDPAEIIFVRNATEAINLVVRSLGDKVVGKGDEIVVTVAEHHSNFVPWQQLAIAKQAKFKVAFIDKETGEIDLAAFKKLLTKKTKLVTFFHISNVLGTINDVNCLSQIVHREAPQAKILIDGAQAVPHMPVDISKLGCDFYVFTGHKMLGPTGIGVLWGKRELLEAMPPFMFGGEMISKVSIDKTTWNELPWKFEAGTPNIAGAIGLGAAVDYLVKVGMENVRKHEIELTKYALEKLSKIDSVTVYGPNFLSRHSGDEQGEDTRIKKLRKDSGQARMTMGRSGVVSFNIGSVHAHDVASILDGEGIAIRSGHHCAQPLMDFLGVSSVARASFYLYNTFDEIQRLIEGIEKVKKTFRINTNTTNDKLQINKRMKNI